MLKYSQHVEPTLGSSHGSVSRHFVRASPSTAPLLSLCPTCRTYLHINKSQYSRKSNQEQGPCAPVRLKSESDRRNIRRHIKVSTTCSFVQPPSVAIRPPVNLATRSGSPVRNASPRTRMGLLKTMALTEWNYCIRRSTPLASRGFNRRSL